MTDDAYDRELEWDSDSNSTASDLSGPGRNFDNLLGIFAHRLEQRVNGAPRPPRPPLPPAPHLSQVSFITDSDAATIHATSGAGHTINKALAWGGAHVERAVTWVARRTGRGPEAAIRAIVKALCFEMSARVVCEHAKCGCIYTPAVPGPPSTYTIPALRDWLLVVMRWRPACPTCGESLYAKEPDRLACVPISPSPAKKLLRLLKSSNSTSRDIALQFITVLSITLPSARATLREVKGERALDRFAESIFANLGADHLLAPSRLALSFIADVNVMTLVQKAECLDVIRYESPDTARVVEDEIVAYSRHPDTQLLMLAALRQPSLLFISDDLWLRLLSAFRTEIENFGDPLQLAVIMDLILSVFPTDSIMDFLVIFRMEYTELERRLPSRLVRALDSIEQQAHNSAQRSQQRLGRPVDRWRRALWRYDPADPEGQPDDDWHLFVDGARADGLAGCGKIDDVWIHAWDSVWSQGTIVRDAPRVREGEHPRCVSQRSRTQSMHELDWRFHLRWSFERVKHIPGWTLADDDMRYSRRGKLKNWQERVANAQRKRSRSI